LFGYGWGPEACGGFLGGRGHCWWSFGVSVGRGARVRVFTSKRLLIEGRRWNGVLSEINVPGMFARYFSIRYVVWQCLSTFCCSALYLYHFFTLELVHC
jgi:hypothetical protein